MHTQGLDSLVSQAFGARDYVKMGLHTQRAILILTIFSIPTAILWSQSAYLLEHVLLIGHETSQLAGVWTRTLCIGLWPSLAYECLRKYLQGQNIIYPAVVATLFGLLFNVACNFLLVKKYNLGFFGAALTVPLTQWVHLITISFLIIFNKLYLIKPREAAPLHNSDIYMKSAAIAKYAVVSSNEEGPGVDVDEGEWGEEDDDVNGGRREKTQKFVEMTKVGNVLLSQSVSPSNRNSSSSSSNSSKNNNSSNSSSSSSSGSESSWPIIDASLFSNWQLVLALGIPGAASLFIEWGSYELAASIAGQMKDNVALATHGIYMVWCGVFGWGGI